jgi:hypothetical protein
MSSRLRTTTLFAELREAWEQGVLTQVKTGTEYYIKKIDRSIDCSLNSRYNICLKVEDANIRIYDRESKSKFIITREIKRNSFHTEAFVTSRMNKFFNIHSSTVFETDALPPSWKEFFDIKNYEEAFPKGSSASSGGGGSYSRSAPLDRETFHYKSYDRDRSINIGKWKEANPNMSIPIRYLPVVNNSFDREYARVAGTLYTLETKQSYSRLWSEYPEVLIC